MPESLIERRVVSLAVETRGDSPTRIGGYAALFDVEAVIAGFFRERIAPGAFATSIGRDDIRALFNHNPDFVLGRNTAGTLRLTETSSGLDYEVDVNPEDPFAVGVAAKVRRRDVTQSSFGFRVVKESWTHPTRADELPLRTLEEVELFDVSPVTYPAYDETTVAARDAAAALREPLTAGASRAGSVELYKLRHRIASLFSGEGR